MLFVMLFAHVEKRSNQLFTDVLQVRCSCVEASFDKVSGLTSCISILKETPTQDKGVVFHWSRIWLSSVKLF